jgi:hypothetical protein
MIGLQIGYQLTLAALTAYALLLGTGPMKRTAATIFAVMLVAWFLADAWPGVNYSLAMILIDALACFIITLHPAGRWQSMIGLTYILQIGVHVGRIARGENADINTFYWGLSLLAILQLLLLGGWMLHGIVGHPRWRRADPASPAPRRPGMAR